MEPNYIELEKQGILNLPKDFYCGLYSLDKDLLVIYQRSVSIIRNAFDGNSTPDNEPFIEMQDYYSYEPPQVVSDLKGRIWCSIGGRMFFKQNINDKWTETEGFYIGDAKPLVTNDGKIIFSTNYQHSVDSEGIIIFDPETKSSKFVSVKGLGKSPIPKQVLPDGRLLVANAATSDSKILEISTLWQKIDKI